MYHACEAHMYGPRLYYTYLSHVYACTYMQAALEEQRKKEAQEAKEREEEAQTLLEAQQQIYNSNRQSSDNI